MSANNPRHSPFVAAADSAAAASADRNNNNTNNNSIDFDDSSSNSSSESIAPSILMAEDKSTPIDSSSPEPASNRQPYNESPQKSSDGLSLDKERFQTNSSSESSSKCPLDTSSSSVNRAQRSRMVRFPTNGTDLARDATADVSTTGGPAGSTAKSSISGGIPPSDQKHKKRPSFIHHLPTHFIPKQIKQMISSPLSSPPIVNNAAIESSQEAVSKMDHPFPRKAPAPPPPRQQQQSEFTVTSAEGDSRFSKPTPQVTVTLAESDNRYSGSGPRREEEQEDYFSPRPSSKPMSEYFPSDENLNRQTWQNTMYNREGALPNELDSDYGHSRGYSRPWSPNYDSSGASTPNSRMSTELLTRPSRAKLPSLGDALFHPSAGMAPGMLSFSDDADADPEKEHQLPQLYDGEGSMEDIPLRRLDTKLQEIKHRAEMSQAAEHAELLVRNYTRGPRRGSRRGTIHDRPRLPTDGTQKASASRSGANSSESVGDTGFIVENTGFLDSEDSLNDHLTDTNETLYEESRHEDYVAPPSHVKLGVLGTLLTMYNQENGSMPPTPGGSPTPCPSTPDLGNFKHGRSSPGGNSKLSERMYSYAKEARPKLQSRFPSYEKNVPKWYQHKRAKSANSLGSMVMSASQTLAAPGIQNDITMGKINRSQLAQKRKNKIKEQIRITVHIADVLQRQRFILRMCKALMLFGAPTHRLEEYMKMTSRVLEIDGQFLYIPGCMLCSFGDSTTHTSEMRLVRVAQGLNLSHLHEAHIIYKEVVHDVIGVEEASSRLDDLLKKRNLYPRWVCTIAFGLASAFFALLSFGGTWTDFPISFVLGGCVGFLQIWIAPRSALYSNVFEVTSSIIVSFVGRAFGSIGANKDTFCFAAIAQGSLALILPGYPILCGSLELQSKNIVSGAVRMFYAVIYSLFLGFGITLGAVIYGWIDRNATSATTCSVTLTPWLKFFFLPGATCFIAMVNQARVRELPIMTILAGIGYVVTYFLNKKLPGAKQFSSAIAAFAVGIFGNIYSRVGHGLAFAAMLPAIFTLVPGGIAAQGSLVAGIKSADDILSNKTGAEDILGATSNSAMSLGINMIQVSVGITVGLFVATLFIYPFGKKRSGLFTF